MAKECCGIKDVAKELPEATPSERSRRRLEHDEWLLDEALSETFPASDSVAVSPSHLLRTGPAGKSREAAQSGGITDCKFRNDHGLDSSALDIPMECAHCHAKIPATVAMSFEGADYIHHFCGAQCIEAWCRKASQL